MTNKLKAISTEIEDFCDYNLNISNGHIGVIGSLINFMKNSSDEDIEISISNTSVEIRFMEKNND
jgi:hypothetical protein